MNRLPIHPLAELLPPMTEAEYGALKADIAEHGQREPIVLLDGKILDGRHRDAACRELKIEPKTTDFKRAWGSPVRFVYSKAVHRNLTDSQKAAAAVGIETELGREAAQRSAANLKQHAPARGGNPSTSEAAGKSRDLAGGLFGVSGRYVSEAKLVLQRDPKLFAEVLAGRVTLPRAKRQIHVAHKRAVLAKRPPLPPGSLTNQQVIVGDCQQKMEPLPRHVFRLAFLDPPYNLGIDYGDGAQADRLHDEVYVSRWGEVCHYIADELLTPDGSLWFLICDEYADFFGLALRNTGLKRVNWIKWYESFGTNCQSRFNRTSRHLFYCVKDLDRRVFNEAAVNRKSDRLAKYKDKRGNPGGKIWDDVWGVNPPIPRVVGNHTDRMPDFKTQLPVELLEAVIGCATEPGDLVLDPTAGSGTTGVAAMRLGRRSVLIEKNPDRAKQMEARLESNALQLEALGGKAASKGGTP